MTTNPEGSTYFLASRQRWMASWYDADGRRKTRVATPNTEKGARATLRKALSDRDNDEHSGRSPTLAEYLPQWLQAKTVAGCRPGTLRAYDERMRLHVIPKLGAVKLSKLTAAQLERLYAAKLAEGLSSSTVFHIHRTLHTLLRSAKRRRLVGRLVTEDVDPPRRAKHEARTLSVEEARRLIVGVRDHHFGPMWIFMLGTGCRLGEAAGLHWHDVDTDNATALICRQLVRERATTGKAKMVAALRDVKTEAGRREAHLPPWVIEALREQRRRNPDGDLVFRSETGGYVTKAPIWRAWHAILKDLGLEGNPGQAPLRMHDLRHSKGTLMADAGEDTTTIQRTLGHARQSITADLYIGKVSGAQRAAAERYGALLDPSSSSRQHVD